MSRQIGAQSQAITSQYLVSQNPNDGYFTSIQAAINQAVSDGNTAVVLVKPGTYSEDITLADNVNIQATGMSQNDPLVTIQGCITATGNITSQVSYCNIQASTSYAFYFTSAAATYVTLLNCNIFSTVANFAALKVDNTNTNSILTIQDSSIVHSSYVPINFIADCQLVIAGSTYIGSTVPMTIQSNTPLTAIVTMTGFNAENYVSLLTADTIVVPGILFDFGYSLAGTQDGSVITFQDTILNIDNATFNAPVTLNGTRGTISNSSFYTYAVANISYNDGTGGSLNNTNFNQCTFSTPTTAAIGGTSTGDITTDTCYTIDPVAGYVAPNLFAAGFLGTIATISYTGGNLGIQKGLRIQREPNNSYQRLAGFAVTAPINYNLSATTMGAYNSICDVNVGASSAASFGYWSSNAVYNGTQWTTETDSTNSGGGYVKVDTSGTLELGCINSSGSTGITVANPDLAFRLTQFESQFQPTYGQFTGSYEVHTQAVYQTTSATPYALYTLTLNPNEAVTISGTVVGASADQSNACGGNFLATATRTSSGNITLVGAPVININTTNTTNFYIAVNTSTQVIQLFVVGLAASNYNWSSFITYHKVLSNL